MSALRASRAALRARSTLTKNPIQKRGYADAVSDKIKLSLALPHSVCSNLRLSFACRRMIQDADDCCISQFTNPPMCTSYLPCGTPPTIEQH